MSQRTISNTHGFDRRTFRLVVLSTALGLGHHIDHVVRGNHVGWPVSPEINEFTYGLLLYPMIVIGLYLTAADRVGAGYWAAVGVIGFVLLAWVHLTVEPPGDIIEPYLPSNVGYLAFLWLLGLLASTALLAAHSSRQWWRVRDSSESS